jgi:hypothetical protein
MVAAFSLVPAAGSQVKTSAGRTAVYESLAWGAPLGEPIPTDGLPADTRQAFLKYASRARQFARRIPEPVGSEEREVWGERTGIERVVFSLFDTRDIAREAEAFVQELPFYYEAEGNIWVVLAVPDAADDYVKAHPRSALRDYALFFAGHRRSCGLRGRELSSTAEGALQLQRARKDLIAAAQSKHPLIRFVANRELNGDCVR